MITWRKKRFTAEEVDKVFCNKCGEECGTFATLSANWGFFSDRVSEEQDSQICKTCYSGFVGEFKHQPNVSKVSLKAEAQKLFTTINKGAL